MQLRIKGLVRAFNGVQAQLRVGIAPNELQRFRNDVQSTVRQVENICRRHGTTPEHLPIPSRKAYQFLKEIDLDNLPMRDAEPQGAAARMFGIKNVVTTGGQLAERMWQQTENRPVLPNATQRLRADIEAHVSTIERICAKRDATPADLKEPSRQVYCWMKFLMSDDTLDAHLAALEHARSAVDAQPSTNTRIVEVQMVNMKRIWQVRQNRNRVVFKCSEGFLVADREIWQALIGSVLTRQTQKRKRLVDAFVESEDFSAVLFDMDALAMDSERSTHGRAHNLDESFDRVNATYFDGTMPKPTLCWNRVLTVRKFGHYQPSRDTVMLSISLDDDSVPAFVVDFVMYHELLHKQHGATLINGRRMVHTPAFRADERRFARYDEAGACIQALARKR